MNGLPCAAMVRTGSHNKLMPKQPILIKQMSGQPRFVFSNGEQWLLDVEFIAAGCELPLATKQAIVAGIQELLRQTLVGDEEKL